MAHVELDGAEPGLWVSTQWTEKELIKQAPGARWVSAAQAWRLPLAWASLVTLRGLFGGMLTYSDEVKAWAWHERQTRVDPALAARGVLELPVVHPGGLFSFQVAGVEFMMAAQSGVLGDEMGLGKTVQALAFLRTVGAAKALPALVICPNTTKLPWAAHVREWLPGATPYVVPRGAATGRKTIRTAAGDPTAVVIVNWEAARLYSRLAPYGSVKLKRCRACDPRYGDENLSVARCEVHPKELNGFGFQTVIADEVHRAKNPKSLQTRAVWQLAHDPSVRARWGLTGTVIANNPAELWSIMHLVAPEDFPTRSKFVDRYCLMAFNAFGGSDVVGVRPDTKDELFRILDPRFRRVTKAEVLPQLPAKVRVPRYVELPHAQLKAYQQLDDTMRTRAADGTLLVVKDRLTITTRLGQFAQGAIEVEKPDVDDVATWRVHLREPSAKLDALDEVLDELGYAGPPPYHRAPVVIAGELLELLTLAETRLVRRGLRVGKLVGATPDGERDRLLQALAARQLDALLFTSGAGGVGVNMQAADTLINLQRSWSLIMEVQKEGRIHRIGSEVHASVQVIDLIAKDTIEERQLHALGTKLRRLDEINRDRARLTDATQRAALEREEQALLSASDADLLHETWPAA